MWPTEQPSAAQIENAEEQGVLSPKGQEKTPVSTNWAVLELSKNVRHVQQRGGRAPGVYKDLSKSQVGYTVFALIHCFTGGLGKFDSVKSIKYC